ncbi:MAG: DEAD/DEAH box helicase family protein [Deferribacteraceae bacterium]|jgi:superfamily II DNA or RNA helicase/sugar phosphate isomerase/epimerase|nr:DEAD/DEAH box helicase family protein [Deferribacteraceae bacterium]
MPIHFGMPVLIENPALEPNLSLCSDLDLDFVELNMNIPEYQINKADADIISKMLAGTGKYLTIHLEENLNVCDFNPFVANAYLETVLQTIEFAREINAPIINMHMTVGVYFTLPDKKIYLFEQYQERYFSGLRLFRDVCDKAICNGNIIICIENCGIYHDFQQKGIDILLESDKFMLTYDIGHDFCIGNANESFILKRAAKLGHMHIHDANDQSDHLPLGEGKIIISDKLSLAEKHNCRCVLETKTVKGLKQSVDFINKIRRKPHKIVSVSVLSPIITNYSTNDEKIDLFLSLFQGRKDVYARRWENSNRKKSGYSPVCKNEWNIVCGKPNKKCTDCKYREFVPFDKYAVIRHLTGKEVAGIYPMLPDESCLFLAIDFDHDGWRQDVSAVCKVCEIHQIPVAVERSRSGNGAHIWFFFDEPLSAVSARKLGTAILTAAMEKCHELKFNSYDRLFPNQDIMPKGGFGNLIALPLQRKPRKDGNSVFIDKNFVKYSDQWEFLSNIKRLTVNKAEHFIAALCRGEELGNLYQTQEDDELKAPWQKKTPEPHLVRTDFPSEVYVFEANLLYIQKEGISQRALNRLKRFAAFRNPEFYRAQAMRLPVWNKPRIISISNETEKYLCLPRGCKIEVKQLLEKLNVEIIWQDKRTEGRIINVSFSGILHDEQEKAFEKLIENDNGVLSASTAFGKTVVAAALIAARKVNALVLVNRKPLLDQWETRLSEFLTINEQLPQFEKKRGRKKELSVIGQLGSGKNNLSGVIDVAVIQSLFHGNVVRDIVKNYGIVIVDECHHVPAVTFEMVLKEVNSKFIYGLTATPKRRDGHQPIIYMHCGPIRYKDDAKLQAKRRPFEHFVIPRFTSFNILTEKDNTRLSINELYADISRDEDRNNMIISDVLEAVSEGRNPLILTERKSHVEFFKNALNGKVQHLIAFLGGQKTEERKRLTEQIKTTPVDQQLVIIATGKYIGEGFDVPRLDTLFLSMPIAWQGTLAQYAGRLHRLCDNKREVRVYDYADIRVAPFDSMYAKRIKGYSAIGYKFKNEGNKPDIENILFDSVNFLPVFTADLYSSTRETVVVSPFLAKYRTEKMLEMFENIVSSEVKVTIVTRPASDYNNNDRERVVQIIKTLKDHNITVAERSKIHQKYAVVDGHIVWYGSINLLSFGRTEESIMRLESKYIADVLLKTVIDTQE